METSMQISAKDRRQIIEDDNDLREMNDLLSRAGTIADKLSRRYEVVMTLWHDTQGSHLIQGRLQGNVAKATLRDRPPSKY
jgi:hypothetical protein